MPVKITLKCGMQITVPVESFQDLIERSIMGSIKLMLSNGHAFHLTKSDIAAVEEIPMAEVNAATAAQKKAEEQAQAAAAEEARKAREDADLKAAAKAAQAIEDAKLKNWIKRWWFGVEPEA